MNRKGFTLVEVLAVIVILSVVMGIASYVVLHVIESSGKKSEEVFVHRITDAFESYISLYGSEFKENDTVTFVKDGKDVKVKKIGFFTLSELVNKGLIDKDKFINPKNKKNCYTYDTKKLRVGVYQSEEYVNYFYFDFSQLDNCDIDAETSQKFRTNMPTYDDFKNKVSDLQLGAYVRVFQQKIIFNNEFGYTGHEGRQQIHLYELTLWRILKKNDDGTVEIISENVSSRGISFKGIKGYQNFVKGLNHFANYYENGIYTVGSRYFGYSNQTLEISENIKFKNPAPWTCTTGAGCNSEESLGGGDTGYESDMNLVREVLGSNKATKPDGTSSSYWVASRKYSYRNSHDYSWDARIVNADGNIGNGVALYSYTSSGFTSSDVSYALRPIVILKSNLICKSGDGSSKDNPCVVDTL